MLLLRKTRMNLRVAGGNPWPFFEIDTTAMIKWLNEEVSFVWTSEIVREMNEQETECSIRQSEKNVREAQWNERGSVASRRDKSTAPRRDKARQDETRQDEIKITSENFKKANLSFLFLETTFQSPSQRLITFACYRNFLWWQEAIPPCPL